jgi:hypothetical protein
MPERYHSGWNIEDEQPSEDPACHDNWTDSAKSLRELTRSYGQGHDDTALETIDLDNYDGDYQKFWDSDNVPTMLAHVQAVLRDNGPVEPRNYEVGIPDHLERTVLFWLRKIVCVDKEHLADDVPAFVRLDCGSHGISATYWADLRHVQPRLERCHR